MVWSSENKGWDQKQAHPALAAGDLPGGGAGVGDLLVAGRSWKGVLGCSFQPTTHKQKVTPHHHCPSSVKSVSRLNFLTLLLTNQGFTCFQLSFGFHNHHYHTIPPHSHCRGRASRPGRTVAARAACGWPPPPRPGCPSRRRGGYIPLGRWCCSGSLPGLWGGSGGDRLQVWWRIQEEDFQLEKRPLRGHCARGWQHTQREQHVHPECRSLGTSSRKQGRQGPPAPALSL